jgi:hypothetical protein
MLSVLAHNVGADSLPAPSWLLGYLGALVVLGAAAWLRGGWTTPRLAAAAAPEPTEAEGAPDPGRWGLLGWTVGLVLLALTLVAAIVGPDEAAANISTLAVFRVWFYALPFFALVLGDVLRAVNPFQPIVAVLERVTGRTGDPDGAPPWTAAVFLFGFSWVFLAHHSPDSPRIVAVTLAVYALAAVAGGLRWGRGWLATGDGFGAISAGLARATGRTAPRPPGLLPLAVVWIGAVTFDGLSQTDFWVEVLGTTEGWHRTMLNTVGLVWMTAIVAAVALVALRVAEAGGRDEDERPAVSLAALLGLALVPLAATWFLADNLPPLLAEGQSFLALLSDPLGKGWDLFGTYDMSIDYSIAQDDWVQWAQLVGLLAGHVGAVVLAHDGALALLGRRRGMRVTWTVAVAAAASFVTATLLVVG